MLLSVVLFIFFPFRYAKIKLEVNLYGKQRLEIIDKINRGELRIVGSGNVSLPTEYKKYSSSGEVHIFHNADDGQVIGFWVFRGMLSSDSVIVMCTDKGEDFIKINGHTHTITKIEKLKDNWYLVEID